MSIFEFRSTLLKFTRTEKTESTSSSSLPSATQPAKLGLTLASDLYVGPYFDCEVRVFVPESSIGLEPRQLKAKSVGLQ